MRCTSAVACAATAARADGLRARRRSALRSPHDRVDDTLVPAEEEDARVCLEAVARVVAQRRRADLEDAAAVVADEEHAATALARVVAMHRRAGKQHAEVVAIGVYGATRAAAGCARARGVGAAADGAIAGEHAVEDRPRDADAAQRGAVAASPVGEAAADDVNRLVAMLGQGPHGAAAEVRASRIAAVADERRADDLQPTAAREDRAAATVVGRPGRVAVRELQVLHHQARARLVVAVRRGPLLPLVAGVLVEDAALPAAAEGDETAAVENDATADVDHLGGPPHLDADGR